MAVTLFMYKIERHIQFCLRNPQTACNGDMFCNIAKRSKLKQKMANLV